MPRTVPRAASEHAGRIAAQGKITKQLENSSAGKDRQAAIEAGQRAVKGKIAKQLERPGI